MRNKSTIITIVVVGVLIIGFILFKFVFGGKTNNYKNIELYSYNNAINLTNEEKNEIIKYIKKENFSKANQVKCMAENKYKIVADDIELSFGDSCIVQYSNSRTMENFHTLISDEFRNYIKNIAN